MRQLQHSAFQYATSAQTAHNTGSQVASTSILYSAKIMALYRLP